MFFQQSQGLSQLVVLTFAITEKAGVFAHAIASARLLFHRLAQLFHLLLGKALQIFWIEARNRLQQFRIKLQGARLHVCQCLIEVFEQLLLGLHRKLIGVIFQCTEAALRRGEILSQLFDVALELLFECVSRVQALVAEPLFRWLIPQLCDFRKLFVFFFLGDDVVFLQLFEPVFHLRPGLGLHRRAFGFSILRHGEEDREGETAGKCDDGPTQGLPAPAPAVVHRRNQCGPATAACGGCGQGIVQLKFGLKPHQGL